ncbi:leucyl aminopeptidase family protein [Methylobacterium nodulans]|uniref:Peptidase M17 leucyl aminopeptidase domain protein n=1 Tax=Methylobacterium nodulans (strain LMG 21967 / CNCM I-2342 / ORS 2060) TaxID=460265 RepID=B8IG63_METNO|nr:leucyl aminopeptidase family protein [Methylobacterium nodulans]ACL61540.1 peptidase M17 leucyl aminopeptidase domain protein [Methylobacterium nodulans ORS 2060]
MTVLLPAADAASACPIWCVAAEDWPALAETLPAPAAAFARATGFAGKPGTHGLLPDAAGGLAGVVFGIDPQGDPFAVGKLADVLPEGLYRFAAPPPDPALAALAWRLSAYRFTRYRDRPAPSARLVVPDGVDPAEIGRIGDAVTAGRHLVNTPANDLGPAEIETAVRTLAERCGAACAVVSGEALERDFPMIAAVGRASDRAPRLIDLTWGDTAAPRVTLVGKGVAFDTGGLDIKPSAAMLLMKKDMAGAAAALAAAEMVMGAGLAVRLRVLVPAVENAISGSAFRPGDVLRSRRGLTVEIGNTDAEGRLILADALALADEESPDLLIDFATLTGAARVALGPDLPALFTEDDALAAAMAEAGRAVNDPVWRMPLWAPYASLLDSKVADLNHVSSGPFAGAVSAALFLRRFAPAAKAHAHLDLYGWNPSTKPGRPEGGEVQTARLVYELLKRRYI